MKEFYIVLALVAGIARLGFGQATCANIGFEDGTMNGWVPTNGSVSDINQRTEYLDEAPGIFENGHLITQLSDGNDPKVFNEPIPMVAPGSTHSIRIGNVTRGSRFDRIRTSYVVTPDNVLLQYKFAVILQFPNHQPFQQPGFSIKVTNEANAVLACNFYEVTAAASISGFQVQGDIRYRNWTAGALDLRDYVGQRITVEVTVHGCTERRHFGYAYFDAQCVKAEVTPQLYCPAYDKTMTLKAPEGFASYRWSNGASGQNVNIVPKAGETYWVKARPFSSLSNDCEFQFDHVVKVPLAEEPARESVTICEGDGYAVGDSVYRNAGTFLTRIRRGEGICDSVVLTTVRVTLLARSTQSKSICEGESFVVGTDVLTATGKYDTRFPRNPPLCDSIVTTNLEVRKLTLELTPDVYIRTEDSTRLNVNVLPGGNYTYDWAAANGLSCATCPTTWARPPETTQYTVTVADRDLNCRASASVRVSVGVCTVFAPNAFTPNGDGYNDIFFLEGSACVELINELVIYDRWGEVIYHVRDFPPSEPDFGWDGMYKGVKVEPGVYPYRAVVAYRTGTVNERHGVVTLIR
ncbi:gliding motility-associated C-terminal domain-containing protein [Salmonirosea aquatica]|uniref:T9SS type B sorting domain-containing protein n=1 Tax=Salmonirosea aquatica TaxID=2654236 RepID=A0A7C9BMC3_9BACT|nr:T9SS type B sorting domain-containing protein [Cytophagaceae bacterium SJW1-29]